MVENPGTEKVSDLLKYIHNGDYVVPYFQRGFEWESGMICDLIESILQEYYTGLILLWDLNPEDARNEKWDPIWGAELKNTPKKAILDGQQRLSSLYYAIYNPNKIFPNRKSYYVFFLDLNKILNKEYDDSVTYKYYSNYQTIKQIMDSNKNWIDSGIIPISILSATDFNYPNKSYIDSKDFDNDLSKYIEINKDQLPEDITTHEVYRVLNGILNYTFVFYPLRDNRTLPDICNIFARVNAKGMRLSTFDLMNAFIYPKGVELRKDLWEKKTNEKLKEIDTNMDEYLLKLISLYKQNYCSSKYIYNLIPGAETLRKNEFGKKYKDRLVKDGDEFRHLWDKACRYAEIARKRIMNNGTLDLGAVKTDFIPNTTIIPVMGAILWSHESKSDTKEFGDNLNKWYWASVFSEDYSGSSDSVMAKDFRDWNEFMEKGKIIERVERINREYILKLDLKNIKKGSSRYKAIICILTLNDARDFYKASSPGIVDYSSDNINDHHIFPNLIKGLDPEKSKDFDDYKDSIVNRTLLLNDTNNKINNKRPSAYLRDLTTYWGDEENVKAILNRHLISEEAFRCMAEDDFDAFVKEREKTIKQHLISKLEL